MAFGGLKKWVEDRAKNVVSVGSRSFDQINPFDSGRSFTTRTPTQTKSIGQNLKDIGNTASRASTSVLAGLGRYGGAGTAQFLGGAYDLLTPGTGTSRISDWGNQKARELDVIGRDHGIEPLYRATQVGAEIASMAAIPKAAANIATKLPRTTAPVVKTVGAWNNRAVPTIANAARKVPVVGRPLSYGVRNGLTATDLAQDAAFTARQISQDSSKGVKITPQRVAGEIAMTAIGNPVASMGTKAVAKGVQTVAKPVIRTAQNRAAQRAFRQAARNLTPEDRAIYEGIWRMHNNPNKVPVQERNFLIAAGRKLDQKYGIDSTVSGSRAEFKQRIESLIDESMKPQRPSLLRDEMGAVGKNIRDASKPPKGQERNSLPQNQNKTTRLDPEQTHLSRDISLRSQSGKQRTENQLESQAIQPAASSSKIDDAANRMPEKHRQATSGKKTSRTSVSSSPSTQERGFVETIIENPNTSPKVKENLTSLYAVRNTKQLQTKAANLVKSDVDLATRIAKEDTSDIGVAVGSELIKKLQNEGNFEQAIDVATTVAETLTKAGQTAQAASIYGRLTPEGVLRFTQRELNKYNKATGKNIKLSPETAKKLTAAAEKIQSMPEGRARDIATKQMLKQVYESMPSTWVEKVSTFQTMAQLLNPKTLIRNIGGNTIFSVIDNTSQALATGIDKVASIKTKQRTTGLPSIRTQAKGLKKGFKEGYEEAVKGINLGPNTQFDLNDVPVFRDGFLGQAEKSLGVSLRATDRAAYQAAFDDTLRNLLRLNKTKTPTTEMLEMAHYQGLYRTFQDDSKASRLFVGLKKALNVAGFEQNGKRWGLGDLILKYPKTPGNLIARGIDYSPVGILRGMIDLARSGGNPSKQMTGANSLARGVVGTGGIIGTGYVLAGLGLITEKPEENKDMRNLQKTAGLGGYQLNVSGLKRFLLSGFNTEEAKLRPGDKLVSYDWVQPAAIPLSMGAAMGRGDSVAKGAGQSANALAEGVETLAEQPLVQGVQDLFGGYSGVTDSLVNIAKGAPASFVPTLSNQFRQLTDNTARNTADQNPAKEALNKAINRVPGLSQALPAQVDVLGSDRQNYQNGSNNPFNVFFNPAFVNSYQPSNAASKSLELFRNTGERKQAPNTAPSKIKINGQDVKLDAKQVGEYQRFTGKYNASTFDEVVQNPYFKNRFSALPENDQVDLLSSIQSDVNTAAKIKLLGDNPEKVSESVQSILDDNLVRAIELKLNKREKVTKSTPKNKTSTNRKSSGGKGSRGGSKTALKSAISTASSAGTAKPIVKVASGSAPSGKLSVPAIRTANRAKAKTFKTQAKKIAKIA